MVSTSHRWRCLILHALFRHLSRRHCQRPFHHNNLTAWPLCFNVVSSSTTLIPFHSRTVNPTHCGAVSHACDPLHGAVVPGCVSPSAPFDPNVRLQSPRASTPSACNRHCRQTSSARWTPSVWPLSAKRLMPSSSRYACGPPPPLSCPLCCADRQLTTHLIGLLRR